MAELKLEEVSKFVKEYITSYDLGFTDIELHIILNTYSNIDSDKFWKALFGSTCGATPNGKFPLHYKHDIETALKCGIEKRSLTQEEFD